MMLGPEAQRSSSPNMNSMRTYKGEIGPIPFSDYKVYGPILHKKQNRRMICLVSLDKSHRTTLAYAKFLYSIHLGRILTKDEEVDHKNNNKLDDVLDNLQILTRPANVKKSAKPKTLIPCICTLCGKSFTRRKGTEPGPFGRKSFCSRSCSAKVQFSGSS